MRNPNKKGLYQNILWKIVIAVLSVSAYYIIFSPYLDNPIEYELKKTNTHLNNEITALQESAALLDSTYSNIKQRDINIFRSLFHDIPNVGEDSDDGTNVNNGVSYQDIEIEALLAILTERTQKLYEIVDKGTDEIISLEKNISAINGSFSYIPSIQPIDNPFFTKSFVASGMKINPFYKGPELHKGFDFAVEEGTTVFATADGIVSKVGETRTGKGGLSVEIDHGNGYETTYAHLSKIRVRKNAKVSKGDIIAHSGNSGYSFMPHLHYEVLYNGVHLAPINFFFGDLSMMDYSNVKYRINETMQSFD